MATPRGLVCDVCWNTLFNTQEYQDLFVPPDGNSLTEEGQQRKVIQQTTSQNVRDNCSFIMQRKDIASSIFLPRSENENAESNSQNKIKCNWCEYIGSYSCCELDEDGKAPEYDEDLLEISLETYRVDCSTPVTSPYAGAKVFMLSMDRRDRKTRQMLTGNGCLHHAFTTGDDPAAAAVVSRPVRSDIDGPGAEEQIKAWIHECDSQECGKDGGFYKETVLPTRVIDVSLDGLRKPRVIETQGVKGVYATLSYCWGGQNSIALRQDNIYQLKTEIKVDSLPQTIQDAIAVTRISCIPYLWVDALCIVQDDEMEKAKEMACMQVIYSSSAITIIASSASDANEGFLSSQKDIESDRYEQPIQIPVRLAPGKFGTMSFVNLNNGICYSEKGEPLSKRAWAFQEQLLSQRKLTFTKHNHTMTWSCPHSRMARAFGHSMHLPYWPGNFSGKEEDFFNVSLNLSALALDPKLLDVNDPYDKDKALSCWLQLVTSYSRRSASLQNDKLNAIAGIGARCYAPLLGPGFYAGMWEHGFLRQLMWKTTDFHDLLPYSGVTVTRPLLEAGQSRAPSWSWASVEGGVVEYDMFPIVGWRKEQEEEWISELVGVTTSPKYGSDSPFGEIAPGSGRIKLRTKLRRAWWHPASHSLFRKSCAPTPSSSLASTSSDETSEEGNDSASKSSIENALAKPENGGEATNKHLGEENNGRENDGDDEDQRENASNPSNSSNAEKPPKPRPIPTYDLLTDRHTNTSSSYLSPFKRVLRRTGPLPPDSDSEFDSDSESSTEVEVADRTWWWLVSASLDEIKIDRTDYEAVSEYRKDEQENRMPFIVYLLPLVAKRGLAPHPRSGRKRVRMADGLVLVKDREAMKGESKRIEEDGTGKEGKKDVLFKRIGSFSSCPVREFDRVRVRDVVVV